MAHFQSKTRQEARHSIGRNLGVITLGVATSTVDTSSLIDTKNLLGGDDEHNQNEVIIYDANCTTGITDGETSIVADFDGANNDATMAPVFSATIVTGDEYEMWKHPWRSADINDAIDQALMGVTGRCLQLKEDSTLFTDTRKYLYTIPTGFVALSKVEYAYNVGYSHLLDDCETAWTKGSANVTVTADGSFKKVGNYSMKAVEDGGSGTNAIIAYETISSTDISDTDKVEFWMYSSITLTAGQLQIKLDDTAAIASALEAIDIPAMTAATWYHHSLSLANPHLDTAIISIGIFQVTDVGAFTCYVDEVETIKSDSIVYKALPTEYWGIARGSTNYIQLTSSALSLVGANKKLRLTGYKNLTLPTADSSTLEIEPEWLINKVTGELLVNHAKSPTLDIDDRKSIGTLRLAQAERGLSAITTNLAQNTEII